MKRSIVLVTVLAALVLAGLPAMAQEPGSATEELVSLVGKAIVEETAQRSEEVRRAKEILETVLRTRGTREERQEARKRYEDAETRYQESAAKLDEARVDALADACAKSPGEIRAMRQSGMGWGRIAKECGVHPSVNGKGNAKGKKPKKPKKSKKK